MERKFILSGLLCLLGFGSTLFAQASVSLTDDTSITTISVSEETFYEDASNQVIYIDFETVQVNLSDLKVKNSNGEVVMNDELSSLPVNTIYELDYSTFEPGDYEIELRSYTGVMTKTVAVK